VRSNVHDTVGFVRNMQRLNVSITRSKHLLLMMGNAATLGGSSGRSPRINSSSSRPRISQGSQEPDARALAGAEKVTGALEQLVQDARERNFLFDGLSVEKCIEPALPPPPPILNIPRTLSDNSHRTVSIHRNQPIARHGSPKRGNKYNGNGNDNDNDNGRTGNGSGGGGSSTGSGGVRGRTW